MVDTMCSKSTETQAEWGREIDCERFFSSASSSSFFYASVYVYVCARKWV